MANKHKDACIPGYLWSTLHSSINKQFSEFCEILWECSHTWKAFKPATSVFGELVKTWVWIQFGRSLDQIED